MNVIIGYLNNKKKTHKYTEITVDFDEIFADDKFGRKLYFAFNSESFGHKDLYTFHYDLTKQLIKYNYISSDDKVVTMRIA